MPLAAKQSLPLQPGQVQSLGQINSYQTIPVCHIILWNSLACKLVDPACVLYLSSQPDLNIVNSTFAKNGKLNE